MSTSIGSKKILYSAFIAWLPFAATIIVLSGMIYCAAWNNYRSNANDPQVQIAEDVVIAIGQGQPADGLVPALGTTELGSTLSPFLMVFNATGTIIGSSISVDGKNPELAESVLAVAKTEGQNRTTWEPKVGVRAAVVIMPYKDSTGEGFVVAGRSLREVDARAKMVLMEIVIGTIAGLAVTLILMLLLAHKTHKISHTEKITEIEIKSEV